MPVGRTVSDTPLSKFRRAEKVGVRRRVVPGQPAADEVTRLADHVQPADAGDVERQRLVLIDQVTVVVGDRRVVDRRDLDDHRAFAERPVTVGCSERESVDAVVSRRWACR